MDDARLRLHQYSPKYTQVETLIKSPLCSKVTRVSLLISEVQRLVAPEERPRPPPPARQRRILSCVILTARYSGPVSVNISSDEDLMVTGQYS